MNHESKIHLYTVWNPALHNDAVKEHIKTLKIEGTVKWLILYSDEVRLAPRNHSVNFRDLCTDRVLFTAPPWDKEITRINKQARNEETLLYIQCLNIFHEPLYVGKIEAFAKIKGQDFNYTDPTLPSYYSTVMYEQNLKAFYSVTLSDIREIKLSEVSNLVPVAEFHSGKYNYAYPFLIHQKKPRAFFSKPSVNMFEKIEIEEQPNRKGGYVVKPIKGSPLKLSEKELELIRFLHKHKSSRINVTTLAKHFNVNNQRVQNLVRRTNKKFQEEFNNIPIKLNKGWYDFQSKIIFTRASNSSSYQNSSS